MLTDEERKRFHAAVKKLKDSGEYDNFVRVHREADFNAHMGPAFLPWHREYLKRYELALRRIDPTVALPYWDSTINQALDTGVQVRRAQDSIMWHNDFMGEVNAKGNLVGHDYFKDWQTTDTCNWQPDDYCPEWIHGHAHNYAGGHMENTTSAGNDPVFYLHHAFIDSIWETWRKKFQGIANDSLCEIEYPEPDPECCFPEHFRYTNMTPFVGLKNEHGLSNKYTDNLYEYAPRPMCTKTEECGSPFLFCDRSISGEPKCVAKLKMGANCQGYVNKEDVCYMSKCINGTCINPLPTTTPEPTTTTGQQQYQPQASDSDGVGQKTERVDTRNQQELPQLQ